ncbi:ATP-dependent protease La domain protein [Tanacetum coccineum]|uniref:ATP-dependent protease La domain protein n=1 Tax=Tanacetum coccineum TaxID=301880 RepID=A0ABQ4WLF8_9ASTR
MSCCINKPFPPTSIATAAVTTSSLLISNITCNSLRTKRRRGSVGYKTHLVNWVCNNGVGLNKKKTSGFVAYAGFLELPLLPFPSDQVLVPSETKTLHLFEARYLKLLDEVEQLDVGALVTIRGIGRVTLVKFAKSEPFLEGVVLPLQDNVPHNEMNNLKGFLNSKKLLMAGKDEPLQTQTTNSLEWALKEPSLDCEESFIPSFAERVSFAALQNMSGSTQSEMLKLQEEKLKAMDMKETEERLEFSLSFVKNRVSMTAAKLAIQSLNMK